MANENTGTNALINTLIERLGSINEENVSIPLTHSVRYYIFHVAVRVSKALFQFVRTAQLR